MEIKNANAKFAFFMKYNIIIFSNKLLILKEEEQIIKYFLAHLLKKGLHIFIMHLYKHFYDASFF